MVFDKRIIIQKRDEESGDFWDWRQFHAHVNKIGGGERDSSGSRRSTASLTFEVRYTSALYQIFLNLQDFRVIYRNAVFNIEDYDDYMERHQTVKLEAVCVGERQNISE